MYIPFNPNPKNQEVGDCTVRDIPEAKELPDYVTREDFNNAIDEIKGLIQRNNFSKNRGDRNAKSNIRSDK